MSSQLVKTGLTFLTIGLLVGMIAIVVKNQWMTQSPVVSPEADRVGVPDKRPDFSLPDLEGRQRHINEWDGKVIVLNFWATWCPPCRKEMPAFVEFREELANKPFEIIGVAIDEAGPVQDFADGIGVEYPLLLGEQEGISIMKGYGNHLGVLPFTVIIDQQGNIVHAFRREVLRKDLEEMVYPLLGMETINATSDTQ